MANYITDPVTGILIPTPGVDPGPDYANNVSNALATLAHLTHTGASNSDGYQIPSAGINFNADISAQSNNLTNLRSTRFTSQPSTLGGVGDINSIYVDTGNLWYNNNAGTPVQITAGGIINVTTSNQWPSKALSNNYTINSSDGYIFFDVTTASIAITMTLPLANSVPFGRLYVIKDASGNAATNHITVQPYGADTIDGAANYVMLNNYGAVAVVSNGSNSWNLLKYSQNIYGNGEFVTFNSGSNLNINTGADVNLNTGSNLIGYSGSTTTFESGSTFVIDTGTAVSAVLAGGGTGITATAAGQVNSAHAAGIYTGTVGGITTGAAAGITSTVAGGISSSTNKAINLGGDGYDVITYGSPHTLYRFIMPLSMGFPNSSWQTDSTGYGLPQTNASTTAPIMIPLSPYLVDGCTLISVTLVLNIGHSHAGLPTVQPGFDVNGAQYGTPTGLQSRFAIPSTFSLGHTGGTGPIYLGAATSSAYYNSGNSQVIVYPVGYPSGGGVTIDKSTYNYYITLYDESGANYPGGGAQNSFWGFYILMSNITDMRIP